MSNSNTAWNILLKGEIIDTVVYGNDITKDVVKADLIIKGYDPKIKLEKTKW